MVVTRIHKFLANDMTVVGEIADHHTHPIFYILVRYINQARYVITHIVLLHSPLHFLSPSAKASEVQTCIKSIEDACES